MNILFCLTPKEKVLCADPKMSVRQVLEKMEQRIHTSIPIVSEEGLYVGTISEGDILWFLKAQKTFDLKKLEQVNIMQIKRAKHNEAVSINNEIEDIIEFLENQTFVPVMDDRNVFIGIITRKAIITYMKLLNKKMN